MTNRESGVARALSLQCSNHFTPYEILHDISEQPADFALLTRIDCHRLGTNSQDEAESERAPRKIQHAARLHLSTRDVAKDDIAVWGLH